MSHANQDPSKRPRLIVEFSLEDSRKVNMLKKRNEKGKQLQIAEKLSEINTDSDKKVPKKNPKISKRSANVNVADSADEKSQKVAKPLSSPSVAAVSMAESSSNDVGKNSEKINNKRANREALKKSRDNKIKKKKKL